MTSRVASAIGTNIATIPSLSIDVYLNWMSVVYTANATVGNRQIVLQILDSAAALVYQASAGAVQAASTARRYNFIPAGGHDTVAVNNEFHIPIPVDFLIPAGGSIVVKDSAAIAAGDSLTLSYGTETPR